MLRFSISNLSTLFFIFFIAPINFVHASLIKTAFINEFHYDNDGADTHEFIELAGSAGLDLSGWEILFYNGGDSETYANITLSGTFTNQSYGFGFLSFNKSGIQNGSADAIALVNNQNQVIQFISYEGSLTALNGAANGLTSTDIGVAESSTTPITESLQLGGIGNKYSDFTWQSASKRTEGMQNHNQQFQSVVVNNSNKTTTVAEPNSALLMLFLFMVFVQQSSVRKRALNG
jgi:hypothetical protein